MAPTNNPLILTANSRLARWLMLDYDRQQKHKKAWETPKILPLSAWLEQVWLETWPDKYLLSKIQSESLWEKFITADPNSTKLSLLHRKSASSQAYQAYTLVQQYKLPTSKKEYQDTLETFSFFQWMYRYEQKLLQWNALDAVNLMDFVSKSIDLKKIILPPSIELKGFATKTPQLQILLDAMERNEVKIQLELPERIDFSDEVSCKAKSAHTCVQKYDDKNHEAITCARWIRKWNQPGKRFGIIVPELENYRSLLQRELAAELCPASVFPENKTELPFNVSQGTPLNQTTPINLIFQILETQTSEIPAALFYSIIRSSAFHSEKSAAIEFEQTSRKQRLVSINLNQLSTQIKIKQSPGLNNFIRAWGTWVSIKKSDLPSKWAEKIFSLLREMDWPVKNNELTLKPETLSKKENLIFDAWKNCLDQLASLNHITGKIHRLTAVNKLLSITQNYLFPEKYRDHLIQVVELSECRGMKFDHTWVMGCHSESLPPSPEPNSLIPSTFRRHLPRSNAKWELKNSEEHLADILESSDDIVFSFPSQEKDNIQEPSPLLKYFPQEKSFVLPSARYKDQICNAIKPEPFEEEFKIPFSNNEKERFKIGKNSGGTNLLKLQADCPFQAFSRYRLHAQTNEIPEVDFDPLVRGNMIHLILEIFWRKFQTRTRLESLYQANQLEVEVKKCVEEATVKITRDLPEQPKFLEMEISRNIFLVLEWLIKFELNRDDFTVLKQEKSDTTKISELTLNLKIDRIDETADKKHVLIDYKTGDAKPKDWLRERIISPQLPLYSTLFSPSVVAFGQIKKGQMGLKGVKDPSTHFPGFIATSYSKETGSSEWEKLLDFWKNKIDQLANEFLSGQAVIDPSLKQETCKNCDLDGLCRIRERDFNSEGEEW